MRVVYYKGMVNKLERSYFAALVDGEGTIGITTTGPKDKKYHQLVVKVSNTYPAPIYRAKELWEGYVYSTQRGRKKRIYIWSLTGYKAAKFLTDILPYMQIKHQQATVAIEYMTLPSGPKVFTRKNPTPASVIAERRRYASEIKRLNRM